MKLNQGIRKSWPASLFVGGGGEETFMKYLICFLLEEFTSNTKSILFVSLFIISAPPWKSSCTSYIPNEIKRN